MALCCPCHLSVRQSLFYHTSNKQRHMRAKGVWICDVILGKLLFRCGHPHRGRQMQVGRLKSAGIFRPISRYISETVQPVTTCDITRCRPRDNRTGPPCSVGHPTTHAPGLAAADRSRARWPARPPTGSVTDDDRRQTPANKTILAH